MSQLTSMLFASAHRSCSDVNPSPAFTRSRQSRKKRRHGALLGVRAHFLVIEAAEHRDGIVVARGQERGKGDVGAPQVIQTRSAYELVAPAPHGRLLAVHQEQIARKHLLGRDACLLGNQPIEGPRPELPRRHDRAQIDGAVRRKTGIRLAIKLDGHARDDQQIRIGRDQAAFHAAARTHQHAAGNGQGPVEPGMIHHAAVCFHIQAHITRRAGKLGGLETLDSGTVTVHGEELGSLKKPQLRKLRRKIGMVFQQFNLLESKTVYHNIALPLILEKVPKAEIDKKVKEVLRFVELEDKKDVYVSQLSGGQKQRVGIARALTTTPDILLCDEATSALDPQTTEAILKLLKKINREMGVTILLITHQMQVVQMICNKVAVMEKGQVVEAGSVLDVFGKPQAPVTKRFVQTVVNDQIPESIISLVKEQKEHFRVERLKFIGSSVKRPVISDICHVEGIVVNILGATVQELQDNIMCVFILQLLGSEEKILKAEKQIDENGVIRERVEVI